jgi:type II secretory pathway component GspD/PulD (secretin)
MRSEFVVALALAAATVMPVAAHDKPQPATAQPADSSAATHVPLKVQLTLMRFKGEKQISSVPYMLGVLTNSQKTSLRMGVQVPVPVTIFTSKSEGGAASVPQTSYTYRDVGTNIDCEAEDAGNGVFSLVIAVDDSTLFLDRSAESADDKKIPRDVPAFRSFRASFAILLRDGQTMQYASATDPISGEVMRIDVGVSLAK